MNKIISKRVFYCVVYLLIIACFCCISIADLKDFEPTEILDKIFFGNAESEISCKTQADIAPIIRGGLGEKARMIGLTGSLSFTIKCSPDLPNLVTIKLWGGDIKQTVLGECGNTFRMEARQVDIYAEGEKLSESSVELLDDAPLLPGLFFYRTAAIPVELTDGKTKITLTIKPAERVGGDYAAVGGPAAERAQAGSFSRGIYAAYTHTDNLFIPPEDVLEKEKLNRLTARLVVPAPDEGKPDFRVIRANLIRALDEAVDELINRQLYGSKFEKAKKELGIPEKVTGLFDWTGLDSYIDRGKNRNFKPDDSDWLTAVTGSASGRGHTGAGQVFMTAYSLAGSRYYRDEQMIKRTIAAIDGYCRYQGEDGGFEIGGGEWGWVGGPQRKRATGGLPGFFAGGLARSFLKLNPILIERPQLSEQMIDNNGDGEKNITRKDAYTQLFRDWLWKDYPRLGLRTACANQDLSNGYGAILVNDCLKHLSPEDTYPENIIIATAKKNVGLMPIAAGLVSFINSLTDSPSDRGGSQYMISSGGITMEWGFCPLYGQHFPPTLSDMCRRIDEPFMVEQFNLYISGIENFILPYSDQAKIRWVVQGVVGSRRQPIFFADLEWKNFIYAADILGNDAAKRIVRIGLANYGNFSDYKHGAQDRMHLCSRVSHTIELIENLDSLQRVWQSEPTDYRLPSERKGQFAWTDPTSSARVLDPVVIKNTDGYILYVQNNRYHFITDEFHSYGTTHIEQNDGLAVGRFSNYLIVINRTDTPDINDSGKPLIYNPPQSLSSAVDLLSGEAVDLTSPLILQPRQAFIFDVGKSPNIKAKRQPKTTFLQSSLDAQTNTISWSWRLIANSEGISSGDLIILKFPEDDQSARKVIQTYIAGGKVLRAYIGGGKERELDILAVNAVDKIIAVSGINVPTGQIAYITIAGLLPSFSDYSKWELKTEGGNPLAHRASIVELRNDDYLQWRLIDSYEDAHSSSITQRTNEWMSFIYPLRRHVQRIEFDYTGGGIDRFVIELRDKTGRLLWENQSENAPKKRIILNDINANEQLVFRVGVKSSHIYADTFHRVENVRIEYAQ